MHQNWKRIVLGVFVVGLLIVSFWYGGNAPGLQGFSVSSTESMVSDNRQQASNVRKPDVKAAADTSVEEDTTEEPENIFQQIVMNVKLKKKASTSSNKTQNSKQAQKNANKSVEKQEKQNKKSNKKSHKKKSSTKTESTTQNIKETTESNNQQENTTGVTTESSDIANTTEQAAEKEEVRKDTVTISISCAILLDQMDLLKDTKKKYVPKGGIILGETEVEIEEGDTVFDVLQRVTKSKKIHLEYSYTPAYKSHYIEGIHNIYEFDAGNLSGWMYCINDEFTGGGCSSHEVEDGDVIQWLYSCELGKDIGSYFEE